jgi:hypothetical protein
VEGERFLSLPLAVKPSIDGGILPLTHLVEGERFLSLPLAVEPSIDGGILPDFLHFPSVLVRHHQHVLEHSLKKEEKHV